MALEDVRNYLKQWQRDRAIIEMDVSTATVPLAAAALGVIPARIAKSISLRIGDRVIILVTAGDARIDNRKFKDRFGFKAKMLSAEETPVLTGHEVGGVCPFALPPGTEVYLDESMKRFNTVFPACGSANSAIELTPAELEEYSPCCGWVDVCQLNS
ncbi:YbaK/EbsC family protein [Treponema sp. OttesenSCG-928-L16]|nr:YbaK/EbsC family protein [Treponema sp. OttesenSCG-928-L16]